MFLFLFYIVSNFKSRKRKRKIMTVVFSMKIIIAIIMVDEFQLA